MAVTRRVAPALPKIHKKKKKLCFCLCCQTNTVVAARHQIFSPSPGPLAVHQTLHFPPLSHLWLWCLFIHFFFFLKILKWTYFVFSKWYFCSSKTDFTPGRKTRSRTPFRTRVGPALLFRITYLISVVVFTVWSGLCSDILRPFTHSYWVLMVFLLSLKAI